METDLVFSDAFHALKERMKVPNTERSTATEMNAVKTLMFTQLDMDDFVMEYVKLILPADIFGVYLSHEHLKKFNYKLMRSVLFLYGFGGYLQDAPSDWTLEQLNTPKNFVAEVFVN